MVFKRCTIGGCDYTHNSINSLADTLFKSSSSISGGVAVVPSASRPGRAMIPVNRLLMEKLNSVEVPSTSAYRSENEEKAKKTTNPVRN